MTADTVGGVWTHVLTLCRGLAGYGVEVMVATMGPRPSDAQRAAAAQLGNVLLRESEFRLEWMASPWADVAMAGEWLLQLEESFSPDVVHLNGYAHGSLPWRAPVIVAAHSCVLSWWRAVRGGAAPRKWDPYRERVRAALQSADLVIAPTRAMLDALHEHYGTLANTRVIPNGRDPAEFKPGAKAACVLCVGRLWDEAKNVRALTDVAPAIAWPICVAGDTTGPDGGECELRHVRALGRCDAGELARHYAEASIYALPARYEPFGLSVLEAALSGCALVLGDIPSLRENWDGAAVFVPPGSRARLSAAINAVIEREPWRRELSTRALERARRFTARRMTESHLDAYQRLRDTARPAETAALSA